MKRMLALLLATLLVLSLTACDLDFKGKIVGSWTCRIEDTEENRNALMETIELYEEEIALVNTPLYTEKTLTFNEDGTYTFSEEAEGVKKYVRTFYKDLFEDLYQGRDTIATLYEGADLSQLTEEEFYQFYAELYTYETFDKLLDALSESVYDYDSFEPYETGTFTVGSDKIVFDADGDEGDGSVEYSVSDDTLTIEYSDSTERYTKVN